MMYQLQIYYNGISQILNENPTCLFQIIKQYSKYFDSDYLFELFLLNKNKSLTSKEVLDNLLWILDDFYKDFTKIELINTEKEVVDFIERDNLNSNKLNYKIKFYYDDKILLSTFSGSSINDLYQKYCHYLPKNNILLEDKEILHRLFIQEYIKSKKKLVKIQALDQSYKVIQEISNLNINSNIAFCITFSNYYSIYDYIFFNNLDDLFIKYNSKDTLEILFSYFNKNYEKYKKISKIAIVDLRDYRIIDSYDINAINNGYIYRLKIIFKDSINYEGYYSSVEDFIEDLEFFYERDKIDKLLNNKDLVTLKDIIEMNKKGYKDAKDIQIIRIENNKSTVVR